MLIAERHNLLQELIAQRGISDLDSLSAELKVSSSTLRRDLELLEQRGLVKRTHGGVIWSGPTSPSPSSNPTASLPYAFDQRMSYQVDAKRQIARAARKLVSANDTILLDGGTTTFYFAQELVGLPLQLVTNSLPIANLFLNDEHVELILTGGLMYPRYGVLLGPMMEHTLDTIHTKTLFLSVAGIHDNALYNQNQLLVQAEQKMLSRAQRAVLLMDSIKLGQQALSRLCDLSQIHTIITDPAIPPDQIKAITSAGCELIIAD
ncbi:MAG TPA: DeoR/GlpR family DNA-binding transcription regulator [Tepidisphaeraceae bacterium]|jgi:DeoR/GlpR family transcriptional regulator of sugar metabolism|nr:DeoR/GlpR family DNA-binding transcription regulator [Tepidisphaeraceae bacterium]